MIDRIKTAAVALPILLAVLFFGGPIGLAALAAVAAVVGMREFLFLLPLTERPAEDLFAVVWSGMVAFSFAAPSPMVPSAALVAGALVLFFLVARNRDPDAEGVRRIGRALAGWLYVGFFLGHAVVVRRYGVEPMFFLIALVMVGDSAAYFVGSWLGKHRLAPRVSPKKSVEGALGGFVFTVAVAAGLSAWTDLPHGALAGAFIGGAVNAAAQVGDLLESYLKRGAGVKDSGGMFPGHGGMLDRLDSFLPTLPVYALSLALMAAP